MKEKTHCDYSYSLKGNLKQHIKSVHEGKNPFQCNLCDYKCTKKGILEKHRVSAHEEIKPIA